MSKRSAEEIIQTVERYIRGESTQVSEAKREFCRQRGIPEKSFYYWRKRLRTPMVGAAAPQLVQPGSLPTEDSVLEIHYRGAEMKLPDGVDVDAVVALLRSIQSL